MRGHKKRIAMLMALVMLLGYIPGDCFAAGGIENAMVTATPGTATPGTATSGTATSSNAYVYIYDVFGTGGNAQRFIEVEVQDKDKSLEELLAVYVPEREAAEGYEFKGWYWYTDEGISEDKNIKEKILKQSFEKVEACHKVDGADGKKTILKVCPGYQILAENMTVTPDKPMVKLDGVKWYQGMVITVENGFLLSSDKDIADKVDSTGEVWKLDETQKYVCWLKDNNSYTFDSEKIEFGIDKEAPGIEGISACPQQDKWVRGVRKYIWSITDSGTGITKKNIQISDKNGNDYSKAFELREIGKSENKHSYELSFDVSENGTYNIQINDRIGNPAPAIILKEERISKGEPSIEAYYEESKNKLVEASEAGDPEYVGINENIVVMVKTAADSNAEIENIKCFINGSDQTPDKVERDDKGNVTFLIDKAKIQEKSNEIEISVTDALKVERKAIYEIKKDISGPCTASVTVIPENIITQDGESMYLVQPGDVIEIRTTDELSGFSSGEADGTIFFASGVPENFISKIEKTSQDGKEWVYRITLKADGTMTEPMLINPIKCTIFDKCGNSRDAELTRKILIDGTGPTISVSYEYVDKYGESKTVSEDEINKVLLSNQKIKAMVTIEDQHLKYTEDGCEIFLVNDTTNTKKKVEAYEEIQEPYRRTICFDIDGEKSGRYHLEIKAEDEAGNGICYDTSKKPYKLYLDKEAPAIWSEGEGYAGEWSKESQVFHIGVSDDFEGIDSVWFTFTENRDFEAPSIKNLENGGYTKAGSGIKKFDIPVNNTQNKKGFYQVWAYDAAGNCGALQWPLEVNIDVEPPLLDEISFDTEAVLKLENGIKAFASDVELSATVKDTDSGIEKIEYQIYDRKKGEYLLSEWQEITPEGENIRIHINSKKIETDDAVVEVRAVDVAGNTNVKQSEGFAIDITKPQAEVALTELKGKYAPDSDSTDEIFPAPRVATITVREHNFSANGIRILVDGELEENVTWVHEGDIHTAIINFSMEGLHTLSMSGKDIFGNDLEVVYKGVEPQSFIVDTGRPQVSITCEYTDAYGVHKDIEMSENVYTNGMVILHLAAQDEWLDWDGSLNVEVTRHDSSGIWKSYEASGLKKETISEGWCKAWNGEIVLQGIANESVTYWLRIKVYDEVGNATEIELKPITIDQGIPSITGFNAIPGGWSAVGNISVSGSLQDDTGFLPENYVYYRMDGSESFSVPTLAQLELDTSLYTGRIESGQNDNDFSFTKISSDCNEYYHFWTYDIAGNPTLVQTGHIQIDTQAPDIIITAEDVSKVWNGNYDINIRVEDGYRNGVRSGLQSMSYTVTADGEVTQSGTMALEGVEQVITITVDAAANEGKDIEISATVTDNAGNSKTYNTESASTDITKPVITVSYDNNEVQNQRYFKGNRIAYITIVDHNFDEKLVNLITDGSVSTWVHDGDNHMATITYDTDGDYEFHISCEDLAGNESESVYYGESVVPEYFTIDKTLPLLWITYDNNDVENGNYYKASRIATIHIKEHNFDPGKAGDGISPATGPWNSQEDEHWATIAFTEEGLQELSGTYTDLAGNTAAEVIQESFVMDKTAPVITAADIVNRKAYNTDEVMPILNVKDDNFDADRVEVQLIGSNAGDVTAKYLVSGSAYGTYGFKNILEDDLYTLRITAMDRAGNTSTSISGVDARDGVTLLEEIQFSVNRNGSVYTLDEYTRQLVENAYVKSVEDVAFYETNVNILNTIRLTIAKDNRSGLLIDEKDLAEITLMEGKGYTIERENVNGGWSCYKYVIDRSNFAEDGIYRLTIYSTDVAGNISENTMEKKLSEINFMVDSTEPICIISDLKSGATYNMVEKTVVLEPQDNLLLDTVEVYLNNVQVACWKDAEYVTDFSFVIPESNQGQNVRIVCVDAAGNIREESIENIYVTTNRWIRLLNNKKLLYSIILGSVAAMMTAGVVGVVLVTRKKRRKGSE